MVNVTAGFVLAAYVLYIVARGDLGRLLWIVGASNPGADLGEKIGAIGGAGVTAPTIGKVTK